MADQQDKDYRHFDRPDSADLIRQINAYNHAGKIAKRVLDAGAALPKTLRLIKGVLQTRLAREYPENVALHLDPEAGEEIYAVDFKSKHGAVTHAAHLPKDVAQMLLSSREEGKLRKNSSE